MLLGLLLSLLITLAYVFSMYLAVYLIFGKQAAWRHFGTDTDLDTTTSIAWTKMVAISIYAGILLLFTLFCLHRWPAGILPNSLEPREILGLSETRCIWKDLLEPLLATVFLQSSFIASLIIKRVLEGNFMLVPKDLWEKLLFAIKDPIIVHGMVVGPIVEELVFRSVLLTLLEEYFGFLPITALLVSSSLFSLAHAHRLIRRIILAGIERKLLQLPAEVLVPSLVQCAFTFAFGLYVGFFFLKRRKVFVCILIHAICNCIGLPINVLFRLPRPLPLGLLTWFIVSVGIFVSVYMDSFASLVSKTQ